MNDATKDLLHKMARHLNLISWHVKELRPSPTAIEEIEGGMYAIQRALEKLDESRCMVCGGTDDEHIANYYCPTFRAQ